MSYASMKKSELVARLEQMDAERSVETRVLALVGRLAVDQGPDSRKPNEADLARAEMALSLAREIDSPSPERPAPAQLSKELRALVDQLEVFCAAVSQEGLFS